MSMAVIDHITSNSELMNQNVASQELNDTQHILAVRDHNQEPLIFTIQKEVIQYGKAQDSTGQGNPDRQPSKFYLVQKNATGKFEVSDLGMKLGFKMDYNADAIGVKQAHGTDLYIALAIAGGTKDSNLVLLNAINPKDLSDDTLRGHIILQDSAQKIQKVVEIYMVSSQETRLIRATCRLIASIHGGIKIYRC